jgi:hypothetical protein
VGLNPFRQHPKSTLDIVVMVGALVLTIAAVAWAITGT